ncbi:2-hydroxyglutaryl-CoA dehydratase [Desulfocarbo indianensis]|nr:2-hydroxyglutaryl-CoA dehydratase [Desulfocarbo indianensis]
MTQEVPPIKATKQMRKIMADYFAGLDRAKKEGSPKVAWCTSVGPGELLLGMGFEVYYPENHGAMLGATRMASDVIPVANAAGYSPDICSYLTSDIGAYLQNVTPLAKAYGMEAIPKADVLVYNNNQCREVQDWFSFYAREWGVPIVGIQNPRMIGEVKKSHLMDVRSQLEGMVPVLEEVSGVKFDIDRFREAVGLSKECTIRWRKVLEAAANRPTPMHFFDHCIHMAPAVVLRGTQQAVDYYDLLLAELDERLKAGVAAVPGEKIRLYWDGMPVWGRLRMLSDLFMELKAPVVSSTYCNSWIFDPLDPKDPFESMARAALEIFNVRDEDFKEGYIKEWVQRCGVQGLVFHDSKTCPYNTNSRFALPNRLSKELGIPTIIINGDLNDLRCFSDEQAKTNIEAFVEQLLEAAA